MSIVNESFAICIACEVFVLFRIQIPEIRDPLGSSYPIGKLDLLIVGDELGLAFVLLIPWEGVKLLWAWNVLFPIHIGQ